MTKSRKKLIYIFILLFLAGLCGLGYINTMVSYQYEVKDGRFFIEQMSNDLSEKEKKARLEEIDKIESDIYTSQLITGVLGLLFFASSLGLGIQSLYARAAEYDKK